eukprot:3676697-Rhodomonas_salina.5
MDGGTRLKVLGDLKEGNRVVDVSFRQVVVLVHEVQAKKEIQCKNGTMAALVVIIVMDDTCSGVKLKLWGRRADWAVSDGLRAGDAVLLSNAKTTQWRDSKVTSAPPSCTHFFFYVPRFGQRLNHLCAARHRARRLSWPQVQIPASVCFAAKKSQAKQQAERAFSNANLA